VKIRVLKSFNGYRVGAVFDWGDGMARVMIARGMIEEVKEDPVERAVAAQDVEQAVTKQPIKRRKRK
jgi:hypothetical protein